MNEQENTVSFFRFEDLRIYAKALEYTKWVYGLINHFSENQKLTLAQSFLKSAESIALHIAEGSSRNKSQFIYYLKLAKSSVRECVVYTELTHKVEVMDDDEKDYSKSQLMELTKMIGSLIASLQRTTSKEENIDPDL